MKRLNHNQKNNLLKKQKKKKKKWSLNGSYKQERALYGKPASKNN